MRIRSNEEIFALTVIALLLTVAFASQLGAVKADNPPPTATSISCSVSPTSFPLGNSTMVSGSISPAVSNVMVTLTYTRSDGTTLIRTVTTGSDSSFSDAYTPDTVGSWSVQANWAGNSAYFGSQSFPTEFTVTQTTSAGLPMIYLYAAIIVIVVVIVAIAVYLYTKRK
jgi:hypothetical protein